MNTQELKWLAKQNGINVQPTYVHDDYIFTSFTMPHPLKRKLDKIAKRQGLSRSKVIQLLLEYSDDKNFFKTIQRMK